MSEIVPDPQLPKYTQFLFVPIEGNPLHAMVTLNDKQQTRNRDYRFVHGSHCDLRMRRL